MLVNLLVCAAFAELLQLLHGRGPSACILQLQHESASGSNLWCNLRRPILRTHTAVVCCWLLLCAAHDRQQLDTAVAAFTAVGKELAVI